MVDDQRQVSVLIDLDTLLHGLSDTSTCEYVDGTPLPVATVRRLCCQARILPVVLSGDGVALDVGDDQRVATPAQRRALEAMHATCSHPDCTIPFDRCEIHHVTPWEHGGLTKLDNLAPVAAHHHVHEGRWTLQLHANRHMTWPSRPNHPPPRHNHQPTTTNHHTSRCLTRRPPPATPGRADGRVHTRCIIERRRRRTRRRRTRR